MMKNIKDLESILDKEIAKLMDISPAYLSEAGKAALEAYKAANWYCGFYDTLDGLWSNDQNFRDLVNVSGKHPEYYKVIKMINRAIEKALGHRE